MRPLAKVLLTLLLLVSFSALAKVKKTQPKEAQADKVDNFVLEQDMARALEEMGIAGFENGFGAHFIESTLTFLKENPEVTLRILDQRLRKWEIPIHLLAVNTKLMEGTVSEGSSLCLKRLPGQTVPPEFALVVIVASKEEKAAFMQQYSIGTETQNSTNLDVTGAAEPCQEI